MMKAPLRLLLLLPLLFAATQAQCPAPADLKQPDGTKHCAQFYTDDSPYYEECCGGSALVVPSEEDQPYLPAAFNNKISSVVVGARCELTVWNRKGKVGYTRKFKAGAYPRLREFRLGIFSNWDDAISSYYCKCS